jgi:hypothetical protein
MSARSLSAVWRSAAALSQEHGLPVFPLRPGVKLPYPGSRGCLDASTNAELIAEWARRYPHANYGVTCGDRRCLVVLDIDRLDAANQLTEWYGVRPQTPTVTTPKPGRHEYYSAPEGAMLRNSAGKLLPGVDTRAHHGYVVGPGSVLADGRGYVTLPNLSFDDVPIAPLPKPILAALLTMTALPARSSTRHFITAPLAQNGDITRRVAGYLRMMPSLTDGQGRNDTAWRIAAFVMHDCGGSPGDAAIALAVWNERNLEPLGARRLAGILKNAGRYGRKRAG